ncbi:hypothetical protein [Brevibacillus nitrificans]|uniref:hypothetical protein n=1 Tax=Brevibacillus nitrificans TaxID=651560 RepID=UPI00286706EA|nr:hypothetical protein [Brevibacillus nitrificans]MDR7314023.1 hypothetical protein [Brevibacillus nitrificans]
MLRYTFDESLITIKETANTNDVTFQITVQTEGMRNRLKQVRSYFEDNKDYTDVLFYTQEDGTFEAIVRNDSIHTFLIHAFRFQCLRSLQWD